MTKRNRLKMPVQVKGLIETRKALKKLAPDLYEQMNKEIRVALKTITDDAKTKVQPSVRGLENWQDQGKPVVSRTKAKTMMAPNLRAFPKYNPLIIKKGLTYSVAQGKRNKAGFVGLYRLLNKSAVGAIIETAGRKNWGGDPQSQSNNPNAGAHFNQRIQGTYGGFKQIGNSRMDKGRLLFKSYVDDQGKVQDAVFAAIRKAEHLFETTTKNDRFGLAA